jgi:hypothetical protein
MLLHFTQKHCAAQQVSKSLSQAYSSSIAANVVAVSQEKTMHTMPHSKLTEFSHQIYLALVYTKVSANIPFQKVMQWIGSSARTHLQRSATTQHRY